MRLLEAAIVTAAVAACADSVEESATGSSANATSASAAATGASGATTGSGGAGGSAVGGGTPGGYRAFGFSGGLEHLAVVKADPARDICARIFLSAPSQTLAVSITVPAQWGIDAAEIGQGAANCTATRMLGRSQAPDGAGGSISWIPPMSCPFCLPTSIDIHATLTFPAGPPWVPASEPLDADGIMVEDWQ